jgi:Spy/CpxP family protein refolding chaperone
MTRHNKKDNLSKKSRMEFYLKNKLEYNDIQLGKYDSLYTNHISAVDSLAKALRREKDERFRYLSAENYSDSAIANSSDRIVLKQKALENKMLQHLRNVRALGTPAQQAKFDTTFLEEMSRKKENNRKQKD